MRWAWVVVLVGAVSAAAQDVELERREAEERARARVASAWEAIEAYGAGLGRGARRAELRRRALRRLEGATEVEEGRRERGLGEELEDLRAYREAIAARLRELTPRLEREEGEGREAPPVVLRVYNVRDVLRRVPVVTAPSVGLGVFAPRRRGVEEAVFFDEEDLGWPVASGVGAEKLLELAEGASGGGFEDVGWVDISGGRLIVRKPEVVQARIAEMLAVLREDLEGDLRLDVRFYEMSPGALRELGGRSLGAEAEGRIEELVGAGRVKLVERRALMAQAGVPQVLVSGGKRSLLVDLSVNATGVVPVVEPVIGIVHEGLVLKLTAQVERATEEVLYELSYSRSALPEGQRSREVSPTGEASKGFDVELPEMVLGRATSVGVSRLGEGVILTGVASEEGGSGMLTVIYVKAEVGR